MILSCCITEIKEFEVLSNNVCKQIIIAEVLEWNRAQKFEIIFYNSYIELVEKFRIGEKYKLECMLKSEVYQDPKTKEKTYFTHIVGLEITEFPLLTFYSKSIFLKLLEIPIFDKCIIFTANNSKTNGLLSNR